MSITDTERLHEVPHLEIGNPDVVDLAGADQVIEGAEGFLDRRERVPGVDVEEIDSVGLQATQALLDAPSDLVARQPDIIRPETRLERTLVAKTMSSLLPWTASPTIDSARPAA